MIYDSIFLTRTFQQNVNQYNHLNICHDTSVFHSGKIIMPHYCDIIMSTMASQINGVLIVYSAICSGADQTRHHSCMSLAFVRGICWWPVNFPHKGPVTRKMFPYGDVIMCNHVGSLSDFQIYSRGRFTKFGQLPKGVFMASSWMETIFLIVLHAFW